MKKKLLAWKIMFIVPGFLVLFSFIVFRDAITSPLKTFCGMLLISTLAIAVWTDFTTRKIPNWLTYTAFSWGIITNLAASIWDWFYPDTTAIVRLSSDSVLQGVGPPFLGAIGFGNALFGGLVCFFCMVVATGLLKSAGGDVKLAVVIGVFLGWRNGLLALCYGYIFAGVIASLIILYEVGLVRILVYFGQWLIWLRMPRDLQKPIMKDSEVLQSKIPLGPYIAFGTCLVFFQIPFFKI